jgi:hypothetical protein
VAHIEDVRNTCKIIFRKLEMGFPLNDLSVDRRIMVRLLITNKMGESELDSCSVSIGTNDRLF